MVKNRPNIYIADRSVKFCRDVRLGLLTKKKYGITCNSNSLLALWNNGKLNCEELIKLLPELYNRI